LIREKTKLIRKKLVDNESIELIDLDSTPKKNERTKLRRSYAIADIAAQASDAAASEHEPNDEYVPQSRPESHAADEATDEDFEEDLDEPTPKKRQKTAKVPVREVVNANRKKHEPPKAEKKVSP
jgi:hypothetical protein